MSTFKLTIEYDGTSFNGWQIQANSKSTVQAKIEEALSRIFKKKRVVLVGAGRTDRGVHARGQVAHFRADTNMYLMEIRQALNYNLPREIVVVDVEEESDDFHAQLDAKWKTYSYIVLNRRYPSALERNRCLFFPRKVNICLMKREALELVGKKDFSSFANTDRSRSGHAVRTLKEFDVRKKGDFIVFNVKADGFLYKMVRNMVGTILEIGAGRFPPGSIRKMLKSRDRRCAGVAVAPQGLYLEKVEY